MTGVSLQDTLPSQTGAGSVSNFAIVSGSNILPITPASPASGGTFSFQTIASLPAGTGGSVAFDVQTNAKTGDLVQNTGKLRSNELPAGVSSTAAATVLATATLSLTKTANPSSIGQNGTTTDTITVRNSGTAAQSLEIQDIVPSQTEFKLGSVAVNAGSSGTSITPSYSADNGLSWGYTPSSGAGGASPGYDRSVNRIRWNVSPSLSGTSPNNSITVGFTVKIR